MDLKDSVYWIAATALAAFVVVPMFYAVALGILGGTGLLPDSAAYLNYTGIVALVSVIPVAWVLR